MWDGDKGERRRALELARVVIRLILEKVCRCVYHCYIVCVGEGGSGGGGIFAARGSCEGGYSAGDVQVWVSLLHCVCVCVCVCM